MSYFLSREEQETVIGKGRTEDSWSVWTSDRTMMTRLDKLVSYGSWKLEKEEYTADGSLVSKKYVAPVECVTFRAFKVQRTLTPEQKQAAAERLKQARGKKNER